MKHASIVELPSNEIIVNRNQGGGSNVPSLLLSHRWLSQTGVTVQH